MRSPNSEDDRDNDIFASMIRLFFYFRRYARDWRYHKDERAWLTRAPGVEPQIKSTNYERGTYYFFDCNTWKKVPREFHLEYDKLEEKPTLQPIAAQ
jgi:CCR4-NOT transcription complex subunit 2